MTGENISKWSRKVLELPVLPVVITTLMKLDLDDDEAFTKLLALAKVDPGLALEVLRVLRVTSDTSVAITSLEKALTRIGTVSLKAIVTNRSSVQVFVPTSHSDTCMWLHFIQVAIASAQLAQSFKSLKVDRNNAYLAGLLHDVGRLVDFERLSKSPSEVDMVGYENPAELLLAEAAAFGHDHVQLGSIAAHAWSLPDYVTGAIEHHHSDLHTVSMKEDELKLIEVVKFADEISMYAMRKGTNDPQAFKRMCQSFFDKRSVFLHKLPRSQEIVDDILLKMIESAEQAFLCLKLGKAPTSCASHA